MHYQVVVRSQSAAGHWDYYPYWAPMRDKDAAKRLARHAAQSGYEAAILQSVTSDMLQRIGRGLVDQRDTSMLPPLRYLPGARVATASGRNEYAAEPGLSRSEELDPSRDGPVKEALDERRLALELGPGGDVTHDAGWQPQPISFPTRWDVLRAWLHLRRRVAQGQLGATTDGAQDDPLPEEALDE